MYILSVRIRYFKKADMETWGIHAISLILAPIPCGWIEMLII